MATTNLSQNRATQRLLKRRAAVATLAPQAAIKAVKQRLRADGAGWFGAEIYYKTGHCCVGGAISDRQCLRVTNSKSCMLIGDLVACESGKTI